jgi:DNA replication protein DnaC
MTLEKRTGECGNCHHDLSQTKWGNIWMPLYCEPCYATLEAARENQERADKEAERRTRALDSLDIPLLYQDATLDTFEIAHRLTTGDALAIHERAQQIEKQARVLQLARRYLGLWEERRDRDKRFEFPHIAIFAGEPGTGKGHIAWAIARAVAVCHGDTVKFAVLSDAIRDIREAWKQRAGEGPSERARLEAYRRPQLLIIDEVSKHAFHGEPSQHLYDLVAWREQRLQPTIITTNEKSKDLASLLGPALVSRAKGWGGVWDFGEADYRVQRREARRAERAA